MSRRAAAAAVLLLAGLRLAGQDRGSLRYRIDPGGSELRWELPATLHTVKGRAPEVSGSVTVEPSARTWRVQGRVVAPAAAMVTGNVSRDRTMREKVLEAGRFPEIVFEVRRVVGDLGALRPGARFTVEVRGELTVHGMTRPVTLPVDVRALQGPVLLSGAFSLPWKQFGLKDPSFGPIRVREPVKVIFRLRAVPL